MYEIDKKYWSTCKICNKDIKEIKKELGGGNIYFPQAFLNHIKNHKVKCEDYFEQYVGIYRPICKCGVCNQKVSVRYRGSKLLWRAYKCGLTEGTKKWSIRAKTERLGKNNPMYGKIPWNANLTKETNSIIRITSENAKGRKCSEKAKIKMSESAKKRIVHGHSGRHHSDETKEFLRKNTLRLIKEGVFKQTKTKPHIIMSHYLDELSIKYEEEKIVGYFSFDFYLPEYNIYLEVDGDYFHSNPRKYPDGPKNNLQKINRTRDISKNNYCKRNNMFLVRFWEFDIINNQKEIKDQLCNLKK